MTTPDGASRTPRSPRVAEALAELAMFAADEFSVDEMLWRLGEVAAVALGVDGVGVMGTRNGAGDRTRFVYASQKLLEPMEYIQEANQTGPCKEAATTLRTVVCSSNDDLEPWPDFAAAARSAGVHSLVAAPMVSRGTCWGVLDLYWQTETTPDDSDLAEIDLLAKVAASYLVIAHDRYEARVAQQQLAARLLHDTLTGLANRELIHELTYHALVNANRRGRPVALLFIDLDKFKAVNDTRGHRAGDTVLTTVAHRMREVVRASDTVSRLSGDEFLILCEDLPDTTDDAGVIALAERILSAIGQPILVDAGPAIVMSASIGIAVTNAQPLVADLIHEADQAMYEAKQRRPRRIVVHRHLYAHPEIPRRALERQLFGALERGEMRVEYQAIVDTSQGRIGAVEALLRWEHPELGLLPAARFIDLAIANGSIVHTGQWMVAEVLEQFQRWQQAAPGAAPDTVFVNFSPQQLIDKQLATVVADQLHAFDIPANVLGIEITEHALDDHRVRPCVAQYRAAGHPLAIDDFGTGYSSLARLIELPVTYLKIDRSIVSQLPADPKARTLLQAILVIADSLNLTVIGEGVETAEQADCLAEAGCRLQQGFFHGHPETAAKLTATLERSGARRATSALPLPRRTDDHLTGLV